MKKLISSTQHDQHVLLWNGSFKDIMTEVDNVLKKEMTICCSMLNCTVETALSQTQIMKLFSKWKIRLPYHYKLMKKVLGFHLKEDRKRNIYSHKSFYYN